VSDTHEVVTTLILVLFVSVWLELTQHLKVLWSSLYNLIDMYTSWCGGYQIGTCVWNCWIPTFSQNVISSQEGCFDLIKLCHD